MACLNYHPSQVKFNDKMYEKLDLLRIAHLMISKLKDWIDHFYLFKGNKD